MAAEHPLVELAAVVADGGALDWATLESSADERQRGVIGCLRTLSEIARIHQTMTTAGTASVPAVRTPLEAGSTWGDLQILDVIGSGRFGDVYKAFDPSLDREVALKVLAQPADHIDDAAAVVEEGRLAAKVRHPNVVTIFGARRIDQQTGVWMEFVRGRTLEAELAAQGALNPEALRRVAVELGGALAAVHAAGLVHRDVKTTNVMRDADGRVVLGDFGAGRHNDADDQSRTGLAGTPAYLAPEIFDGRPATPQSDIYSLGVLLYRLATGRFPVSARSLRGFRAAHETQTPTRVGTLRRDLPQSLTDAIDRALSSDPRARFENATALVRAVDVPRLDSHPGREGIARRRAVAVGVALAAVAGLVVIVLAIWPGSNVGPRHAVEPDPEQVASAKTPEPAAQPPTVRPDSVPTVKIPAGNRSAPPRASGAARAAIERPATQGLTVVHLTQELQARFAFRGPSFGGQIPCSPRGRPAGPSVGLCNLQTGSIQMLRESTLASLGPPAKPAQSSVVGPILLSPDGLRLAYIWAVGNTTALHVIDVNGENDKPIHTLTPGAITIRRWMPDGRSLFVEDRFDGRQRDVLASLESSAVILRTRLPEDQAADLSPDGRTIVVSRRVDTNTDLVALDATTAAERWRLSDPANDSFPKFTPDGTSVVFVSDRLGGQSVFRVDLTERGPAGQAALLGEFGRQRVELIAFGASGSLFMTVTPAARTALAADLDLTSHSIGTPWSIDSRAVEDTMAAAWSPDDTRIAYLRGRARGADVTAPTQIVIRNADGATQWEHTLRGTFMNHGNQVEWSPEGDRLAVLYLPSPEPTPGAPSRLVPALEIIDVVSRRSHRLRTGGMFDPKWDPSGGAIYVGTSNAIIRMDLSGAGESAVYVPGEPDRIMKFDLWPETGALALLVVSPAQPGRCRLRVVREGQAHADIPLTSDCTSVAWVDDSRVLVSTLRPGAELLLVDAATGRQTKLPLSMEGLMDLRPRRDGRRLLFSAGNPRPDVYEMSGLLPRR